MSAPYGHQQQQQQQQPPQWYNSPTMQALQNFQTDYVQPQQQQQHTQWGEETQAGVGIRHLVDSEHRKMTPVLDYTVGIVSPDDQSVTSQNYRSRQLLYPEPKAKHYYPVGNYMSKPSYLLPSPGPKAAFDTMFQTNLPAPPSVLKPGQRKGGHYHKPSSPQQNSWGNAPSPSNQGPYTNGSSSSSYSRPAWVGGSSNSSMSGGMSPQPPSGGSISRMVQWPPPSPTGPPQQQQQQQQQQPQQQQGGYSIQQPSWQRPNLNNGPAAYEIEVANPDPASRVVHMQYNSPMGLYSAQNVADSLQGQTGLNPTVRKANDFRQSPTYQALMSDNRGGSSNM